MELDGNGNLTVNTQPSFPKLVCQNHLIDGLEQSGPKCRVQLHRAVNDDCAYLVFMHPFVPLCELYSPSGSQSNAAATLRMPVMTSRVSCSAMVLGTGMITLRSISSSERGSAPLW